MPRGRRALRHAQLKGPLWPQARLDAIRELATEIGIGDLADLASTPAPDDRTWAACELRLRDAEGHAHNRWLRRRTWMIVDDRVRRLPEWG
jgi:hypothetical protein